ncbi:non-ribosomal peptide synthetase [Exilibacterium tricleocarpae]|uniref:non-ribosomal peptide synthetase n=1 Tax=Exilibacterium tricleocarpae TaxID=2591008 RepID=UPI001C554F11|nr:non-ribosomal peptide synthetase [Exilibacterium tricleocarpae]
MQAETYEAPVGEIEQVLADIWQALLGVARVGRRDNFYQLGGHSLLAIRLVAAVQQRLGRALSIREVFEHPVLKDLSHQLNAAHFITREPIAAVARDKPLPLSWAQQRLWFLAQLDGAGEAYHLPVALRLCGPLAVPALEATLATIVARHEVLRTVFTQTHGEARQVIRPTADFVLAHRDLSHLEEEARERSVKAQAQEAAAAAFDLKHGPLLRGCLLRLSPREHVLLLTLHHIVADAWSMQVLAREINTLYLAYRAGAADPLPPLPIHYADYAVWQRRWLAGSARERQEAYWQKHLQDAPALLELPVDRARPAQQSYRGDSIAVTLAHDTVARIKALAQAQGLTLHMVLYTAWVLVLSRLSGQDRIVVGTPVANRQRPELEGLIGFFVNTLPLCADLSDNPGVAELLQRVKALSLAGYAHQDVPFERIVEVVQPVRSMSHSPVFQVLFNLEPDVDNALELPELQVRTLAGHYTNAQFDLSLSLRDGAAGITGRLEYATALFERETVERWVTYFLQALDNLGTDLQQPVHTLEILPQAERERLSAPGRQVQPANSHRLLHELFEAQVAANPNAVALVYEGDRLSYTQLNRRANQLAHHLIERGVAPETLVGICMEPAPAVVIGILAVLKAGGAYVPLDPASPEARLAFQLDDAKLSIILTDSASLPALSGAAGEVLCLDDESLQKALADRPPHSPVVELQADSLAYVIYTSGSTGWPKGVLVEHRNVCRLFRATESNFDFKETDVWTLFHSFAFDFSVWELWGALLHGGRLVLVPKMVARSAPEFYTLLARERVTVLNQTPSAFNPLMEVEQDDDAPALSLRYIIFGGEALNPSMLAPWVRRHGDSVQLINMYGITETTVHVTWRPLAAADILQASGLSVMGRPLADLSVLLLTAHGALAPPGAVGEIYVGGAGLARGYLQRADLTRERFIAHPFSPGERLYRTGDLARYSRDGELVYLGRSDQQIKLRGFRIELGEIETQLAAHPDVAAAVVELRESSAGNPQLAAYVTAPDGGAPSLPVLRQYLHNRLPEYMLPSALVVLAALPLTANGKVDRKALPAPDNRGVSSPSYAPPLGETEQILAAIWKALLGIERVGRWDNFFELGGHSLLAIRLLSMVQERLGRALSIRALFENPGLAALAHRLDAAHFVTPEPIVPADRDRPLPLSWSQQRLWFIAQLEGAGQAYHLPAALHLRGVLSVAALERTLATLIARHEVLRTVFNEQQGEPCQEIRPPGDFELPQEDLSELSPAARRQAVDTRARAELASPFDLRAGPLFRARLLRLGAREHVLLVTMHHIVSDAWSMGVLVDEFNQLYRAYQADKPDPLPPQFIQYADYAVWQRRWLVGAELERQEAYWQSHLDGAPPLLSLPTDRPRPARQSYRGDSVAITLSPVVSERLRALASAEGLTLHMVLFTAWVIVLARLSGQEQIVVGTPVANRQRRELEGLLGFFVNTLPLRADLSGEPTVRELLLRVKELSLAGYAHQDVPFERMVEILQPARTMSHSPLFQVFFNLDNDTGKAVELAGLQVTAADTRVAIAKFDLLLSLQDRGTDISGQLDFAADLFYRATIERWAGYFTRLVETLADACEQPVQQVDILPAGERRRLLGDCGPTEVTDRAAGLIHKLFEKQVEHNPQALAVLDRERRLTFAELNSDANRLAHELIARGVGPDTRVGIYMTRAAELVTGILGILKAGAAYVPLEPGAPAARLSFQIQDAGLDIVLTQQALASAAPLASTRALCLDDGAVRDRLAKRSAANPAVEAVGLNSGHLAYVIYTSGSTGHPKGVEVVHSGVVNYLHHTTKNYFPTAAGAVVNTALSFDATVTSLLGPLAAGKYVRLLEPDSFENEIAALQTLLASAVDVLVFKMTPVHLQALLQNFGDTDCVSRLPHQLVIGGEQLHRSLVSAWKRRLLPNATFINEYGPTETVVGCATFTLAGPADLPDDTASVPIGRPIANTQLYVVDNYLHIVPTGVVGELLIGGAGLARGYLQQAQLTADKFIVDPFAKAPARLVYRTGDLVRRRGDGNLEFIGRTDNQVKLRGFRIELGEIESQLAALPPVREAAVVLHREVSSDDGGGRASLVAYASVSDEGEFQAQAIREQLAANLPEYMLPSQFILLPSLPLTVNGKVDRQALPAPAVACPSTAEREPPRGETERVLVDIWQRLLQRESVGRSDDFYALGGHSLLGLRLVAEVQQRLAKPLSIRELFEHPRLRDLAQRLDAADFVTQAPVTPAAGCHPIPLSWAQQRLWFIAQLDEAQPAYHIPVALRLRGELSVAALRAALDGVLARHEILRTVFEQHRGEPRQVVLPAPAFDLLSVDLTALPAAARQRAVTDETAKEAARPFDLSRGPLIRGRLLQVQASEYALLITMHHIVSDAWSLDILINDINILYRAHLAGAADPLPPLPVQYGDYAVWQREHLSGAQMEAQAAYWQAHLQGAPALLALPTDRPRPASQSYRGDVLEVALPQSSVEAARALATEAGLTLHMFFQTAWVILLSRLSGQDQVVVGTPVANRQRLELQSLVGFFVNTLALRIDLSGNPGVGELLARVKAANLAGYARQDVPFEQVVELVQPLRSASHSPLFQVLFNFDYAFDNTLALADVKVSALEKKQTSVQFDLSLSLKDGAAGIAGTLEYATDLFDRATVERWMVYYTRLVDALVANPQASIAQLAILPAAERRLLLTRGDRGEAAGGDAVSIHGLFETRARRHPGAVAAEQGEAQLTYATLNARANQLAHYLLSRAVEPGELVGLYLPRSLDFLVAMLGILKAGAAYVVLDTDQPPARLQQIRRSADLRLLVSCTTLAQGDFADGLCLDDTELQAGLAAAPTDNPNLPIAADSPAYAYFTSGSSGRPKGALNSHRGVVSTMLAMADELALTPADRVLQFAALGFDVVVEEIYPAWFAGATVVLRESDALLDAAGLQALLARRRITVCELMSGYWSLWLAYLEQQGQRPPAGLRAVLLGGDRVAVKDYRRFQSFGVAVLGVFGLTETGCTSLVYRPGAVAPGEGYLPAGRPLANTRVYVLDAGGQPVPVGVAGELYIGGAGVGLGYVGEPQLSRERFIADPFDTELSVSETSVSESSVSESSVSESSVSESSVSESSVSESSAPEFLAPEPARLFKTGDRVRWLPDAAGAPDTIEFLGRLDQQIKLRGFRIELGDIEAHLLAHAAVREAVVVQHKTGADGARLVAYVTLEATTVTAASLRDHLKASLSDYMIPAAFIVMQSLPLTGHGKIDRSALPEPDAGQLAAREYQAPQGETEVALAAIWQDLLALETVGRQDDFFELGGHSLLIMQLINAIDFKFGVQIPLGVLYQKSGFIEAAEIIDIYLYRIAAQETLGGAAGELEEGII